MTVTSSHVPDRANGLNRLLHNLLCSVLIDVGEGRWRPTLRSVLFCTMMLVAVLPISVFYVWVERNSFQRELASVYDSHLVIARNLSGALNRYVADAKTIFDLEVRNAFLLKPGNDFQNALTNFHICNIQILDAKNRLVVRLDGDASHTTAMPRAQELTELRAIAEASAGEIVISGLRRHAGRPHFFILQTLDHGRLALAPLSPEYVIELQKSVAFGKRGHAMVVDGSGRVVAHPNASWQRESKDASALPVVQAMMAGKTGVTRFWSPPMQAEMVAGYTVVPGAGWGVMVPQPVSELRARASEVQSAALIVALVQFSLCLVLSWKFSFWLSRPIMSIAIAARMLAQGGFRARIGRLPRHTPAELEQTSQAFDSMVDTFEQITGRLQFALKEAEKISEERARLLHAAQAANAAKSQFVSMVSHELRTPLTSIKGALDLLDAQVAGDMPDAARSLVDMAARNGSRLAIMIDDLLDLEKLDAGKLQFEFETADLGALVEEAVKTHSGYGSLAGVTFAFDRPAAPILAVVDPGRIQQVLANLLSNAAKFSQAGQTVTVTVQTMSGQARISVEDQGCGVPAGTGDSIFDAFVQADSSDTRVVGGTGLGLSIARMIVERHAGTLTYSSALGEGTTFVIELPLKRENEV